MGMGMGMGDGSAGRGKGGTYFTEDDLGCVGYGVMC